MTEILTNICLSAGALLLSFSIPAIILYIIDMVIKIKSRLWYK